MNHVTKSMKHKNVFFTVACLILAALLGTNTVFANTVDDVQGVIDGIAMYKMRESGGENRQGTAEKEATAQNSGEERDRENTGCVLFQRWADGAICEGAGTDSDAYAYALYKLGLADVSLYCDALEEYLSENTVRSATTRLKYALCLCMKDPAHDYIAKTLEDSIGQLGIMSFVYGLHLANNGAIGRAYTPEQIALEILAMQHSDGGWSIMGQNGDVDVTAMVLQALAGIGAESTRSGEPGANSARSSEPGADSARSGGRPASIAIAIERAVRFLSGKQNPDGGYSGFGNENAESTAQVLIALSSLGIDADADSRFIKEGNTVLDGIRKYALTDGSFEHIAGGGSDSSATSQVFTALASYICFKAGDIYYMVGTPRAESLLKTEDMLKNLPAYARTEEGSNAGAEPGEESEKPGADSVTPGGTENGTPGGKSEIPGGTENGTPGETESGTPGGTENGTPGGTESVTPGGTENGTPGETESAEPGEESDGAVPAALQNTDSGDGIKNVLLLSILGLAILSCVMLIIFKKRNPKNFIFVVIVAGVAAAFVFFSDFKTESAYYTTEDRLEEVAGETTITIRCDSIAGESDDGFIPENGIILDTTTYEFEEGDTVYDILVRAVRENKIHMEKKKTGSGPRDYYICAIANIYEYDWGDLSGWMYYVNGESPAVGCGEYHVRQGDRIEWHYTREIGRDIVAG